MEKQSLIKCYCALFLVLVLLASYNNGVAIAESTSPFSSAANKATTTTTSPTPPSSAKPNIDADNSMHTLPLILSILALAASGGAIALSILKNKEVGISIISLNNKLKSLEKNCTDLSTSQANSHLNQQRETSSRNSVDSTDTNIYLETIIDGLSERISKLEGKLQLAQTNNHLNNTYSYSQSRNLEADINSFNQINSTQSGITQSLENLAYIELVNIYNNTPRLLEQKAIKVSEAQDSINRRHTDSSQKIVLEKANNCNYWVVHDNAGLDWWLLPKRKLRIEQFRYETTKALFDCHGYQPEYYSFQLVKPAKVIPLSVDEQTWQLEEPGILEFTV